MGKWCFGLRPTDVWWATSDIGWIVGHSYMVYAPLLTGCTTVVFEGALDYPQAERQLARGGRGVRRHRHLHVADRRPHADALRRRAAARDRPLPPRARRLCRRGAQRAGLGLAAEHDSRRPRAGHRSHVADRDERAGVRQSVRPRPAADQAGVGGDPAARHRRGGGHARRHAVRRRRKRHHGAEAPVSRTDRRAVGRARTLRPRLLGAHSRRLLQRRLGAHRRGRLRLVRRPRRRDHQDRRPPHRHHRGRERVPEASGGRRMRRDRPSRRTARRGDFGVRAAEARPHAVGGAAPGGASTRSAASWVRWRSSAS